MKLYLPKGDPVAGVVLPAEAVDGINSALGLIGPLESARTLAGRVQQVARHLRLDVLGTVRGEAGMLVAVDLPDDPDRLFGALGVATHRLHRAENLVDTGNRELVQALWERAAGRLGLPDSAVQPSLVGQNIMGKDVVERLFGRSFIADNTGHGEWQAHKDGGKKSDNGRAPLFLRAETDADWAMMARTVVASVAQNARMSSKELNSLFEAGRAGGGTAPSMTVFRELIEQETTLAITRGFVSQSDEIIRVSSGLPAHEERTGTKLTLAQFSTPPAVGMIADRFLGTSAQSILEPTVGNGTLAAASAARGAQITAFEMDEGRAGRAAAALGGRASVEVGDARQLMQEQGLFDAILANPPFGSGDGPRVVELSNFGAGKETFKVTSLDAEIAVEALNKVRPGGSAVLVMPAEIIEPSKIDGQRAKLDILFKRMFEDVGTVALDAKLYKGMGANTPVLVHFLKDRADDLLPLAAAIEKASSEVNVVGSFHELGDWVSDRFVLGDAAVAPAPPVDPVEEVPEAEAPVAPVDPADKDTGSVPPSPGQAPSETPREPSEGVEPPPTVVEPEEAVGASQEPPEAPVVTVSEPEAGPDPDLRMPEWFDQRLEVDPFTENYLPFSSVGEGSVVIQKTLQGPVYQALSDVQKQVGDLDEYTAGKLGLPVERLREGGILSPEQIDSVALGFYKRDNGEGMIIGDKMGVGKGRQLAAHALAAMRDGSPVLFTTLDATLFTDFAGRDLRDVSGRPLGKMIDDGTIRPFIFNSGPEAALKDPDTGAVVFRTSNSSRNDAKKDSKIDGTANMVMLTYSQLQTQSGHWRLQSVLNWLDDNAGKQPLLLLDEVHKAAGVESRTGVWMSSIIDKAREVGGNVVYSSATSMKSGKNIVVYSAALPDTGIATNELTDLMESNPLSMQEVLSAEMASAGRLIEREMPSNAPREPVRLADLGREKMEYAREMTDVAAGFLAELVEVAPDIRKAAQEEAKARFGGLLLNAQDKTVDVTTTSPVSQFDNYSRYLMLAVKGNFAEELLLRSIARGEKPTAVVDSTADTLTQWVMAQHAGFGDTVHPNVGHEIDGHPNIGHVLQRNAARLLEAKIETAMGTSEVVRMDAFGGWLDDFQSRLRMYDWSGLRVNVLDRLEEVSEANGLTFKDITRRSLTVKEDNGRFFVRSRDPADKATAIREYGAGVTDVLALNRGAATGLSAHASPAVGPDLRRRSMIAFQFQRDIADQRQVEGRVNRFAQVSVPIYYTPSTGFAADERLANLFNRANRNLTSSTSATRENSATIEGVDLLNPVGDAAVAAWAKQNGEVAAKMEISPDGMDLGRKLLGRIVMLGLEEQEAVLSEIDILFSMQMEKLTREGRNPLRLSRFEWGANVETISTLVDGDADAKSMADKPVVLNRVRYSETVHWQSATRAADRVRDFVSSRPETNDPSEVFSFERLRDERGVLNFAHEIFDEARAGGAATSQIFRGIDPVLAEALDSAYRQAAQPSNVVEGKPRSEVATTIFFDDMRSIEKYGPDTPVAKAWDEIKEKELKSGEVFRPSRYMGGLDRASDRANFLAANGSLLTPGSVVGIRLNAISDYMTGEFGRAFRRNGLDDGVVPAVILSVRTPEEKMGTFANWNVTFMAAGSRGASTVSLSSMRSALDDGDDNGRNSSPIVPISRFYHTLRASSRNEQILETVYGEAWRDVWSELSNAVSKIDRDTVPNVQKSQGFQLFSAVNDRVPSGHRVEERHVLEGNLFKALNFVTAKSGKADGEKAIYTDSDGIARHAVVLSENNLDKVMVHLERYARHSAQSTKAFSNAERLKAFIEVVHSTFVVGSGDAPPERQVELLERLSDGLKVIDPAASNALLTDADGDPAEIYKALAKKMGNLSEDMPVSLSIGSDVWKGAYAPDQGRGRRRNVYASYPASVEVREPRNWESAPAMIDYRLSLRPIRQALDTMGPSTLTAFLSHQEVMSVAFRKTNALKDTPAFQRMIADSSDQFAREKLPRGVLVKNFDLREQDDVENLVEVLSVAASAQKGEMAVSGPAKRLLSAIGRFAKEADKSSDLEGDKDIRVEHRVYSELAL